MEFQKKSVWLTFDAKAQMGRRRNEPMHEIALSFRDWQPSNRSQLSEPLAAPEAGERIFVAKSEAQKLLFTLEICESLERMSVRLCVENKGEESVFLHKLTPVSIRQNGIKLGNVASREWRLYRQGRHKNDLPSVCTLGKRDDCLEDALSSLLETGGEAKRGSGGVFQSDQLTVLSSQEGTLLLAFTTGARQMVECLVSVEESGQLTAINASCLLDCYLQPGAMQSSEWLSIAAPKDVFAEIERFAVRKAALYGARKALKAPSVFCTWYYYGLTVSEKDCMENLALLSDRHIPFNVFQIDEGWEITLGDWRPNERFPSGMAQMAKRIEAAGFVPGIWTSPYIAHETAPVCQAHPDWFLKDGSGAYCLFPMNDTVYRVLDITHPAAVEWTCTLYRTLRGDGYRYHKLDFTRAAVIQKPAAYYNEDIPITQAYRTAVAKLREAMGEDAYFLMCGGLYDPLLGVVDGQRSGSDVLSMWSNKGKGGGKAVPFTTKQNLLRYWMSHWWDNDPDALMIRRQPQMDRGLNLTLGLLNEEEVKTVTLNQYLGAGLICSTEPLKQIDDDRLFALRHLMPYVSVKAIPRDLFEGGRYPNVVDVAVQDGKWHTVVFINWSDVERKTLTLTVDKAMLGDFVTASERYVVSEFFSGACVSDVRMGETLTLGVIEPHGAALVKVAREGGEPVVVGSSAHYSMGGELLQLCIKGSQLLFESDCLFEHPIDYTIRLPRHYHATRLPACVSAIGGNLRIHLQGRGHYRIEMPLARDP